MSRVDLDRLAVALVQQVAELPDRTSLNEWPEAMLVTADELHAIVLAGLTEAAGAELRSALTTYGQHKIDCKKWTREWGTAGYEDVILTDVPCSCGYAALVEMQL